VVVSIFKIKNKHVAAQDTRVCLLKDHQRKPLDYYCSRCNKPICAACRIHGHQDHEREVKNIHVYKEIKRKQLKEAIGRLNPVEQRIKTHFDLLINATKKSIERQGML
jgi:hypothetical protein